MKKTLVKSRSKKFGAILTVSSLLINFLSPVAALAQGSPDIQMAEDSDFVHNPEDIELPDLEKLEDLRIPEIERGNLDDLKMPEIERGQIDLSDIQEPNPTHQMEVEVGSFAELQRVIDEAVPDTALVIDITSNIEFEESIVIEGGLDITLQSLSSSTRRLTQRNGRHFIVQSNSLLTLKDRVRLDGASRAGGIEVHNGIFNMTGGDIWNNVSSEAGGGVYVNNGEFTMGGGRFDNNTARCIYRT